MCFNNCFACEQGSFFLFLYRRLKRIEDIESFNKSLSKIKINLKIILVNRLFKLELHTVHTMHIIDGKQQKQTPLVLKKCLLI